MSKEILSIRCTAQEKEELTRLLYSIKSIQGKQNNIKIIIKALSDYNHELLSQI